MDENMKKIYGVRKTVKNGYWTGVVAGKTPEGDCIFVMTKESDEENLRFLVVDDAVQSVSYIQEDRRNELYSPYLRQMSYAFSCRPNIARTLLLGGGGFAYPKFYISHYPDKTMDVVEISRDMVEVSRYLFYLEEMVTQQGMRWEDVLPDAGRSASDAGGESETARRARLRIYIEDAKNYLLRCAKQYDFIINDVYSGKHESGGLLTEEGMRLVRARLTPGGLYVINAATAAAGPHSRSGKRTERLLKQHFRYVTVMQCDETRPKWELQNFLMFASDEAL